MYLLFEVSLAAFLHSGRPLCSSQDFCASLENEACKAGVQRIRELLKVTGRTDSLKESIAKKKIAIHLIISTGLYTLNEYEAKNNHKVQKLSSLRGHTTTEHCPDTQLEDAPWAPLSPLTSPWKHLGMKGNKLFKLWATNLDSLKAVPYNFLKIKHKAQQPSALSKVKY